VILHSRYFLFFFLLAGCGYQWDTHRKEDGTLPTIAIPFVAGDQEGALTFEIAKRLTLEGIAHVNAPHNRYLLKGKIVHFSNQTIGYRRDSQKINGENKKNLVGCEGRKIGKVQVTLYESASSKIVLGPILIEADVDYDYVDGDSIQDLEFVDTQGMTQLVLPFSLGQLESSESAREAASKPWQIRIAKKIAALLENMD
jgi:hypothetical protein